MEILDKTLKEIVNGYLGAFHKYELVHTENREGFLIDQPTTFSFCDAKRKIGIEVETENNRNVPRHVSHVWHAKADGSLRNGGIEYITPPIAGSTIEKYVRFLFTNLPPEIDFSERTSIHVHVNVRNYTVDNLYSLLLHYLAFEKLLYTFAGKRYHNLFCFPLQETAIPYKLQRLFLNDPESLPMLLRHIWGKYSGLNLLPVFDIGTVEYRHMEGHRNPERLLNWVNILLRLHKFAQATPFLKAYEQLKELNTTSAYEQYIEQCFGKDAGLLLNNVHARDAMEDGIAILKEVSIPSPFVRELISEMNSDSPLLQSMKVSAMCRNTELLPKVNVPLHKRVLANDPEIALMQRYFEAPPDMLADRPDLAPRRRR